jgi:transposase
MNGNKERPKVTAGLDLGDKYSYLCLLDTESGEVIEEGRLRTSPEAFRRRFASELPMRIAIEAGTHSPWVSRILEECAHEVLVANARKLRLIYTNKRKTDEIDAENLARLARVDPKLLYPLKHRGEDSQAHMALIRSREALVSCRTQLVNHVRGAVKSFGHRLPKCPASGFHNKAAEHIPQALWPALGPILEQIGSLTERIRQYDRKLQEISKEHYPETGLLRQVEGIGPLTALTFVFTLEDPYRFEKSRSVGAYLGLCQPAIARERVTPKTHLQGGRPDAKEASGERCPLYLGSLRFGLRSKTPRPEESLPRRQERKETGGGGSGQEALCALAQFVGERGGLRTPPQHPPRRTSGGGGLERGSR